MTAVDLPMLPALQQRLETLRGRGAANSFASRCQMIDSLLIRCTKRSPAVSQRLCNTASQALSRLQSDFEQRHARALQHLQQAALPADQQQHCHQLLQQGRFGCLAKAIQNYRASTPHSSPLAGLLAELSPGASPQQSQNAQLSLPLNSATELPSVSEFRQLWVSINSERRVELAVEEGPEEAGPLNQDKLAIRTLTAMQQLAPEYLTRYLTYADTLLWLQQAQLDSKKATAKHAKKPIKKAKS